MTHYRDEGGGLGDDQGDVVVLFVGGELADVGEGFLVGLRCGGLTEVTNAQGFVGANVKHSAAEAPGACATIVARNNSIHRLAILQLTRRHVPPRIHLSL